VTGGNLTRDYRDRLSLTRRLGQLPLAAEWQSPGWHGHGVTVGAPGRPARRARRWVLVTDSDALPVAHCGQPAARRPHCQGTVTARPVLSHRRLTVPVLTALAGCCVGIMNLILSHRDRTRTARPPDCQTSSTVLSYHSDSDAIMMRSESQAGTQAHWQYRHGPAARCLGLASVHSGHS
jgi:hypothetical protein